MKSDARIIAWKSPIYQLWIPIWVDYGDYNEFSNLFFFYAISNMLFYAVGSVFAIYQTRIFYMSSVLHPNLRFIFNSNFICYQIYIIGSFITTFRQIGFIQNQADILIEILLLTAATMRVSFMTFNFLIIIVIVIERLVATIKIGNYEKRRSNFIGVFIIGLETLLSLFLSYLFVNYLIGIIFGICLVVFIGFPGVLIFTFIYQFNKNKRKRLQQNSCSSHDSYSLSMRYQLTENLYVIKLLLFMVITTFTSGAVTMTLLTIIGKTEINFWKQPLFAFFVELIQTLSPLAVMYHVNRSEYIRRCSSSKVHAVPSETQLYFKQLQQSWK